MGAHHARTLNDRKARKRERVRMLVAYRLAGYPGLRRTMRTPTRARNASARGCMCEVATARREAKGNKRR
jgi:hypothetical protein